MTKAEKGMILFIDDDQICHTLVELIVPHFTNYQLVSAFDGKHAMQLAYQYRNQLSVIVIDLMLPDTDGYNLYRKMRDDFDNVAFLFQSGLPNQEKIIAERFDQKLHILYKPYKQQELLDAIEKSLSYVK